jgi:predicted GIY-YIG superfamily endonuclease
MVVKEKDNYFNCVYFLKNLFTNQLYIGAAHDFNDRLKNHFYGKLKVDIDIQIYGFDVFEYIILEDDIPNCMLVEREITNIIAFGTYHNDFHYNQVLKAGFIQYGKYNGKYRHDLNRQQICIDYDSGMSSCEVAKKHNTESHTVLNICRDNNIHIRTNSEVKKGQRAWCKGLTKETDERVKRISDALTNVPKSEEHKQKLRNPRPSIQGKNHYNFGSTKENNEKFRKTTEKISKSRIESGVAKGKNNPRYRQDLEDNKDFILRLHECNYSWTWIAKIMNTNTKTLIEKRKKWGVF